MPRFSNSIKVASLVISVVEHSFGIFVGGCNVVELATTVAIVADDVVLAPDATDTSCVDLCVRKLVSASDVRRADNGGAGTTNEAPYKQ